MARRAVKAAPPPAPVAGAGLATADPVADDGSAGTASPPSDPVIVDPKITPASILALRHTGWSASARAPALRITVLWGRPVFACGRWFQPGADAPCPPGYFSARQWRELQAHPALRVQVIDPTNPEAAP